MLYYKKQLNTLHDTFHPMPTCHLQWVFQKENCLRTSSALSYFCVQLKRGKYVTISLFTTAEKTVFFCNFIFFLWMPWSKNVRLWTTWHLQVSKAPESLLEISFCRFCFWTRPTEFVFTRFTEFGWFIWLYAFPAS